MKLPVSMLMFLIACGSSGSMPGGGNGPADAPGSTTDASGTTDGPSGPTITIQGTAFDLEITGPVALANVTIGAYANTDETTPVNTATTGPDGKYMLQIPATGAALDGFIKASKTGFVDTYVYPPAPITANFAGADANMLTSGATGNFAELGTVIGQTAGQGIIVLEIEDATAKFVAGATATVTPNTMATKVEYTQGGLLPVANNVAASTAADGRVFMINVPPSAGVTVTVGASVVNSSTTFKSHDLKVRADVLTTTLITP